VGRLRIYNAKLETRGGSCPTGGKRIKKMVLNLSMKRKGGVTWNKSLKFSQVFTRQPKLRTKNLSKGNKRARFGREDLPPLIEEEDWEEIGEGRGLKQRGFWV